MHSFKKLSFWALIVVFVLGFVTCGLAQEASLLDEIQKRGVLRVGCMLDFPPLGWRNEKGEPMGYNVRLAEDMAKAVLVAGTQDAEVTRAATEVAEMSAARATRARIFIHYGSERQRAMAMRVARSLGAQGYVVPEIEQVTKQPSRAELRYFWPDDENTAREIAARLGKLNVRVVTVYLEGFENRVPMQDFEIWMPIR